MSFIENLLNSIDELEPPKSFWYWSALTAISATVKDNIWIERGGDYYKLYPNIYVMLHAESGMKKGPPVSLAKYLVSKVNNTRIISGRSSIQGMLKEMGTAYTVPGGKVITKSVAFICSSELTSSIVEDKAAATILTDLFDRHYNEGDWKSLLKMETFSLKDPTVTMLTATNEAHSEDFFVKRDIQGGFFARTFIINETEENAINSLIFPLKNPINRESMVEYLKELAKLSGPFLALGNAAREATPAGRIYDDWYRDFKQTIKDQKIKDSTGTLNRFGDAVLKVAMLIALSKQPTMELDIDSMIEAIAKCEKLIGNIRKVTTGSGGKSTFTAQKTIVIHELLGRQPHRITRQQLLNKYWMHFDSNTFDEIIYPSLNAAGIVTMENNGGTLFYEMSEEQALQWKKFFEGKNK